jgi:DNA-binding winged helix-turn-helix (wHTH) protein/Tol biopolymer transport system component
VHFFASLLLGIQDEDFYLFLKLLRLSEHDLVMSNQAVQMLEFGPFRIDAVRRLLHRNGTIVDIPPKAFAVLLVLAERRGTLVSKQELMDAVWPNTAVEENNLARSISTLRKALGEKSGEHRYILTMPGSGYSFVAEETPGGNGNGFTLDSQPKSHLIERPIPRFAALAVLSVAVVLWISGHARTVDGLEKFRFRRLSTSQTYPSAALSPDGGLVVYAAGAPGQESIRLRLIESDREVELLPASDRSYSGITFAPDGRHVFLIANHGTTKANVLLRLALSGGPPTEVARELDSPAAVSPDASRIAFVREAQGESVLFEHTLADGKLRRLAAAQLPVFLDYPTWSPDGKFIAYTQATPGGVFLQELAMHTGQQRQIGQRWQYVRRFSWRPGSNGFLISAIEPGGSGFSLFQVDRANGVFKPLTGNVDSLHSAIASLDGTRVLTVAERSLSAVWVGTPSGAEKWRQLSPPSDNVTEVAWISDGNILLERTSAGGKSVRLVAPDGTEKKELLSPGPHTNIRFCSNQRKLVYYSALPDRAGLWTTDVRSGASSRLVALTAEAVPECTPDPHSIWFVSRDPRWWPGLWRIPIDGGTPRRIHQRAGIRYAISDDGRYAAYLDQQGIASPQKQVTQILVDTLDGSGAVKRFEAAQNLARLAPLRWMPRQPMITYADDRAGNSEIWGQRLSGGPPKQITRLSGGTIKSFDWSPDGKQLVVSRGMQSFELLLLEMSP